MRSDNRPRLSGCSKRTSACWIAPASSAGTDAARPACFFTPLHLPTLATCWILSPIMSTLEKTSRGSAAERLYQGTHPRLCVGPVAERVSIYCAEARCIARTMPPVRYSGAHLTAVGSSSCTEMTVDAARVGCSLAESYAVFHARLGVVITRLRVSFVPQSLLNHERDHGEIPCSSD